MRVLLTFFVFFFALLLAGPADAQYFEWAFNPKGNDYDLSNDITSDKSGNNYLTGYFRSENLDYGGTTLINTGGVDGYGTPCFDMMVGKTTRSGAVVWARKFGQQNFFESGEGIACDEDGNVYVTGWFTSSSLQLDTITISNGGGWDAFIIKIDPAGNDSWAYSLGGGSDDVGNDICVDSDGNVIVAGYFWCSAITFGSTTLTNSGSCDVFMAKYDPAGNVIWAKKAGGGGQDVGTGLSTDADDNIYLCGMFSSANMNFGSNTLATSGSTDAFTAKYNASGTDLWAKKAGGNKLDHAWAVSACTQNGCVVTGAYTSTVLTLGTTTLTNALANTYDAFIARYDSSGNLLWAKRAGMDKDDLGRGVACSQTGKIYMTGDFISNTLAFSTVSVQNTDQSGTFSDAYVACFDESGNELWITGVVGLYNENAWSVSTDTLEHAYMTGSFESLSIDLSGIGCSNTGSTDFFYARMGPDTNSSAVTRIHAESQMILFPNPADEMVTVSMPAGFVADRLRLYDLGGRLIESVFDPGNHGEWQYVIPEVQDGCYIISVSGVSGNLQTLLMIRRR